ncbi:hypothetical protein [Dyella sp. Tek66A03]|uniref:hypothetical protein n=1 Tax=Dyella sp. Tek66A03 TaxID=3458298 RepID=UPI00403E9DC3
MTDESQPEGAAQEQQRQQGGHPQDLAKEERELRQQMFDKFRDEQLTRERANSDKYDNTILTFCSGTLALSLTFIKDVVPLATANHIWALKTSWVCLVIAMLLMLASFPVGQAANRESVQFAQEYYIDDVKTSFDKKGTAGKTLTWLNHLAGATFFIGILLTTAFVWINVQEHSSMTDKSDKKTTTTTTTKTTTVTTFAMDGTSSAKMAQMPMVNLQGGTPAAKMQAVNNPTPASAPAPAAASTSSTTTPKTTK